MLTNTTVTPCRDTGKWHCVVTTCRDTTVTPCCDTTVTPCCDTVKWHSVVTTCCDPSCDNMERVIKRVVAAVAVMAAVSCLLVAVSGSSAAEPRGNGARLVIPSSHRNSIGRVPLSEKEDNFNRLPAVVEVKPAVPPPPPSTSAKSYTKFRAPNPQSYNRPVSAEATIVFPDDDETEMVASMRTVDDGLGRPSDMHAIILESGEDADLFSRALHAFQERTYTNQQEPEPPTQQWPQGEPQGRGRHRRGVPGYGLRLYRWSLKLWTPDLYSTGATARSGALLSMEGLHDTPPTDVKWWTGYMRYVLIYFLRDRFHLYLLMWKKNCAKKHFLLK